VSWRTGSGSEDMPTTTETTEDEESIGEWSNQSDEECARQGRQHDFPSGCPKPCCMEGCEMIRFPRHSLDGAVVLLLKRGHRHGSTFHRMHTHE